MGEPIVCEVCGQNHPFELPPELLKAALSRDLVVFAGAGVSTEARNVYADTLLEVIANELKMSHDVPFPRVMSAFEKKHGRPMLLQRIRHRFDYMKGFPELYDLASRFHREIATAYFLREIVTTNWDTLFEDVADATPIVIPEDYAFWNIEGRKVFKLHGSMHNLSTIV